MVPEVSVLLIDRGTGKRVLDLKKVGLLFSSMDHFDFLTTGGIKAPSLESRFRQLHGSLADEVTPFSESHKGIHVDGILSLGSVSTKSLQFICKSALSSVLCFNGLIERRRQSDSDRGNPALRRD